MKKDFYQPRKLQEYRPLWVSHAHFHQKLYYKTPYFLFCFVICAWPTKPRFQAFESRPFRAAAIYEYGVFINGGHLWHGPLKCELVIASFPYPTRNNLVHVYSKLIVFRNFKSSKRIFEFLFEFWSKWTLKESKDYWTTCSLRNKL